MKVGDLVVVPHGFEFYVAEVMGDAFYGAERRAEDSAYRRPVRWLNDKMPIPRSYAKSALISRTKVYGTSAAAGDLVDEILERLELASKGETPNFRADLQSALVK